MRGSRELDRTARGPLPRDRVRSPAPGVRCPRCHRADRYGPCLLCRPDLVPARYGGDRIIMRADAAIIAARLPGPPRSVSIAGRRRAP